MGDEKDVEKVLWAPFLKSLALWAGYLMWPTIWGITAPQLAPKSHEQNCSFEYPVALAMVCVFFIPLIFGLKSRWFRKWSAIILCIWIINFVYILKYTHGVLYMVYSDIYLEFVDQKHKLPRSLFGKSI